MWRNNYVIGCNEYLISKLSEYTFPWVYSLQFLFKFTHHSWRYERKCKWVFFLNTVYNQKKIKQKKLKQTNASAVCYDLASKKARSIVRLINWCVLNVCRGHVVFRVTLCTMRQPDQLSVRRSPEVAVGQNGTSTPGTLRYRCCRLDTHGCLVHRSATLSTWCSLFLLDR